MTELNLSSGITVREEAPRTRVIQDISSSVLAALGVTERGPHEPTLVTSFSEFLNIFGGDHESSDLVPAIRGFFDEGGYQAWIKRIVHYADIDVNTPSSVKASGTLQSAVGAPGAGTILGTVAGPWPLADGETLDFSIDGGGTDTATFNADAATVTGSATETFALSDGQTLIVEIDNGSPQTITFLTSEFSDIANATAAEVAAVINAKILGARATVSAGAVVITSDVLGTDSDVNVTGGTAATTLGLNGATDAGGGDCADSTQVTAAEMKTLIEGDVTGCTVSEETGGYLRVTSNTTGVSSSVQVEATSTLDDDFGFDNAVHSGTSGAAEDALEVEGKTDGAYGNNIRIIIENASSGETEEFNLTVEYDGLEVEVFPNLTMDTAADRFAETIINGTNGSNYITVDEPSPALEYRPANQTSAYLTGGDDGLTSLDVNDFLGSATGGTGLRALDIIEDIRLLIMPGQESAAAQLGMITYCETTREGTMFAVLDPQSGDTASEMVSYLGTSGLEGVSEYAAIYYPMVKVLNPDEAIYGDSDDITVYPSGHVAGVYARVASSVPGGVYLPPAGTERGFFRTVIGLENDETKDKAKRDLLYPKRINPLTVRNGRVMIDGVRVLDGTGNFPSVSERLGVINIEESIKGGIEFARYRNNDQDLRSEVRRAITLYLITQMRVGAFRSKKPSEAFFVDVSDELNPPEVVFAGQLKIKLGLATQKPVEFINIVVSQDTRVFDEALALASA